MEEFIFGTHSTTQFRMEQESARRKGITHEQRRTPRDPEPGQSINLELRAGPEFPGDQAWVYWTNDGNEPQGHAGTATVGHVLRMECVKTEWDSLVWGYSRLYVADLPGQPAGTVVRYILGVSNTLGEEVLADAGALYSFYVDHDPTPDWAKEAVIYHVFVDRFNPGAGHPWLDPVRLSGFFGGRLQGVTEKLDYIASLGATVLWLSPIFPSPSHHGYDATNYFDIEPRLGSKADLKLLLDEAHRRGMRVLLDFVANHWSVQHSTFRSAVTDPESPYRDWYHFRHWPDQFTGFFDSYDMARINLRNPAARKSMLEAAAYWLEFGVDGYRLDYAIGPDPDFWADFRRVTRSVRPDCWTFGEVTEPPDRQLSFAGALDGCLDFVLADTLRDAIGRGRWSGDRLGDFLSRHRAAFPASFSRPSFLDNHDMNRFLWLAGNDQRRLRLAALCQFTLSGPPIIYYGTETGLSQERDAHDALEEARLPQLWDERQDACLVSYYRSLAAMRRSEPFLKDASLKVEQSDQETLAYSLSPADQPGTKRLLAVLNLSANRRLLEIDGQWNTPVMATGLDVEISRQPNRTIINLPPLAGMVFR